MLLVLLAVALEAHLMPMDLMAVPAVAEVVQHLEQGSVVQVILQLLRHHRVTMVEAQVV
jgi:hypothetical protein